MKKDFNFKQVYTVVVGRFADYEHLGTGDYIFHTKEFSNVKDAAKYLKQVRNDIHAVNFVFTKDWKYNNIINGAVDEVFVWIMRSTRITGWHDYKSKFYKVYRPRIFLDENNEYADLNK